MPRLFVGNFDFESELAAPGLTMSQPARRHNAELAAVWCAVAGAGDLIWTPKPFSVEFLNSLAEAGFCDLETVSEVERIPEGYELVPWGWTAAVHQWGLKVRAHCHAPPLELVRQLNSRTYLVSCNKEFNYASCETLCRSVTEVGVALNSLPDETSRWVVKAEYSHAA